MSTQTLPVQIEIGFDQFKKVLARTGAEFLQEGPAAFTAKFSTVSWTLVVDFLIQASNNVVWTNKTKLKHPWCVVIHCHGAKEQLVSDFPATATVDQFRVFCLEALRAKIITLVQGEFGQAKAFQRLLAEIPDIEKQQVAPNRHHDAYLQQKELERQLARQSKKTAFVKYVPTTKT